MNIREVLAYSFAGVLLSRFIANRRTKNGDPTRAHWVRGEFAGDNKFKGWK